MNTVKDQLGIDFDDLGLAEAIDNVTDNQIQMDRVYEAIGKAIGKDGGLLEDGGDNDYKIKACEAIKDIAWESEEVMDMLEHYARQSTKFMERVES